jgi:8-oxo-dGTP diphosphatase
MASDQKLQDMGEIHLCVEVYAIHQGKVLMHRRSKNKKHFPGYLIGPGGHINEGESVVEAACREVEEETGIILSPLSMKLKYCGIHHHVDTNTVWVCYGYLSRPSIVKGKLTQSAEGLSEWIGFDELIQAKDTVFPPTREYFDHILNDTPGILYTNSEWGGNPLALLHTLSRAVVIS